MNKTRAVCVLLLFLLLGREGIAQNNTTTGNLTLKQSIETALANNLDVQQRGLLAQRSQIEWNQARLVLIADARVIEALRVEGARLRAGRA